MSHKGPFIFFRILGALLVLGLIFGAGAFGYKAGMAQGIAQAPAVAKAIEKAAESGQAAPVPPMYGGYGYGYYPRMYGHPHGFSPFGAICGSIFFLFFFMGLMKMMFFRRMRHGWEHHGHCGGRDAMFNEWHKRAHAAPAKEETKEETKEE